MELPAVSKNVTIFSRENFYHCLKKSGVLFLSCETCSLNCLVSENDCVTNYKFLHNVTLAKYVTKLRKIYNIIMRAFVEIIS
jgi:hypothetical protein